MKGAKKSNTVRKGTSVPLLRGHAFFHGELPPWLRQQEAAVVCVLGGQLRPEGMRAARAVLKEVSVIRGWPPHLSGLGKVAKATAEFLLGSVSFRPDRRSVCFKEPPPTSGMAHVQQFLALFKPFPIKSHWQFLLQLVERMVGDIHPLR